MDTVLNGGVPAGASVVVEGAPGTGKTTLAMQFLHQGAAVGEAGLYITFEELPEQLYREMDAYGWDLKELEREGKLRVVSISPDLLMEQMLEPGGLFEQLVAETAAKRIVLDSISLYRYGNLSVREQRETFYRLRSVLKRHGLTALLIREESLSEEDKPAFENYVFDGVIRLRLKVYMEKYRMRTVEVTKMRGRPLLEGEHVYRITGEGIHVVPARSMVEDVAVLKNQKCVSTGLDRLDQVLDGGLAEGTVYLLDTNSKANYKYIMGSIVAKRFEQGETVIALLSSFNSPMEMTNMLAAHGISLEEIIEKERLYLVEHYRRPHPKGLSDYILDVSRHSNQEYREWLAQVLEPVFKKGFSEGRKFFVYYDLNTIVAERGKEFIRNYFAEETAWARSMGVTVLALCNFAEIGDEIASYLERTCNGVLRTWVDGCYQHIQVTKAPNGKISEPMLVENMEERPFIRMV
ncbi:gas vesicle protein GvpD [Paenibacillus aurantius]|uniref:Gas vesicle protein GvpD n=1 Tax=Paenibacillus aurantius TaxID=2918900 RepID=A0AA96LF52_9BACL|nr:ATPase domain-containing protein [Paenibacillus aurantius]WNQ12019.1 gas vesicle protein GvpD [Paenibacillus aurantius]